LNSAKQLTQQPGWVREGYKYTYFPYDAKAHRADFKHEGGLLAPLEKLEVVDVVAVASPGAPAQKQVLAVFRQDGKDWAVPIGISLGKDEYQIYADEVFYIQDPHLLYQHWSKEVWDAIEKHEVRRGMNELQAAFAVGMGTEVPGAQKPDSKVVQYPNGGNPLVVTFEPFQYGKAAQVTPGTAPAAPAASSGASR
jgi:hypothetical protein